MDRGRFELEHRGRSDEMAHFVGLDVSVKETSVCIVDDAGKVILEQKVPTEPADIIALLSSLGVAYGRIGIEGTFAGTRGNERDAPFSDLHRSMTCRPGVSLLLRTDL